MMSNVYCAHCGKQDAIMFANHMGSLFTKDNKPSILNGDALYASIEFSRGPDFIPFFCDSCKKWFAIFSIPFESNIEEEKN